MHRRVGGGALPALVFLNLCALAVAFSQVLERPRVALTHPEPVPKTCPQDAVATGVTNLDEEIRIRHSYEATFHNSNL